MCGDTEKPTVNTALYGDLDGLLKDRSVSPNLHNPPNLVLDVGSGSFVGNRNSLCDDGGKCQRKVLLVACLGLLDNFCNNEWVR